MARPVNIRDPKVLKEYAEALVLWLLDPREIDDEDAVGGITIEALKEGILPSALHPAIASGLETMALGLVVRDLLVSGSIDPGTRNLDATKAAVLVTQPGSETQVGATWGANQDRPEAGWPDKVGIVVRLPDSADRRDWSVRLIQPEGEAEIPGGAWAELTFSNPLAGHSYFRVLDNVSIKEVTQLQTWTAENATIFKGKLGDKIVTKASLSDELDEDILDNALAAAAASELAKHLEAELNAIGVEVDHDNWADAPANSAHVSPTGYGVIVNSSIPSASLLPNLVFRTQTDISRGGQYVIIRVPAGVDPASVRVRQTLDSDDSQTAIYDQGDPNGWHELAVDSRTWDFYVYGASSSGTTIAAAAASTLQVQLGTATHTFKLKDGLVTLDSLAAAVVARIAPALTGHGSKALAANEAATALAFVDSTPDLTARASISALAPKLDAIESLETTYGAWRRQTHDDASDGYGIGIYTGSRVSDTSALPSDFGSNASRWGETENLPTDSTVYLFFRVPPGVDPLTVSARLSGGGTYPSGDQKLRGVTVPRSMDQHGDVYWLVQADDTALGISTPSTASQMLAWIRSVSHAYQVPLDALAAAVVARLLPATSRSEAGRILEVSAQGQWVSSPASWALTQLSNAVLARMAPALTGNKGKILEANEDEDGLVFVDKPEGGGGTPDDGSVGIDQLAAAVIARLLPAVQRAQAGRIVVVDSQGRWSATPASWGLSQLADAVLARMAPPLAGQKQKYLRAAEDESALEFTDQPTNDADETSVRLAAIAEVLSQHSADLDAIEVVTVHTAWADAAANSQGFNSRGYGVAMIADVGSDEYADIRANTFKTRATQAANHAAYVVVKAPRGSDITAVRVQSGATSDNQVDATEPAGDNAWGEPFTSDEYHEWYVLRNRSGTPLLVSAPVSTQFFQVQLATRTSTFSLKDGIATLAALADEVVARIAPALTGQGGKFLAAATDESALQFVNAPGGGGGDPNEAVPERAESIKFQAVAAGTSDVEAAPLASNPVAVVIGSGSAEILTGVTGNDFTVKAGIYVAKVQAAATAGHTDATLRFDIRKASDDSILCYSTSPAFTSSGKEDIGAILVLALAEDTAINVLVDRGSRGTVALDANWILTVYRTSAGSAATRLAELEEELDQVREVAVDESLIAYGRQSPPGGFGPAYTPDLYHLLNWRHTSAGIGEHQSDPANLVAGVIPAGLQSHDGTLYMTLMDGRDQRVNLAENVSRLVAFDPRTGGITRIGSALNFGAAALNDDTVGHSFEPNGGLAINAEGEAYLIAGSTNTADDRAYTGVFPLNLETGAISAKVHQVEAGDTANWYRYGAFVNGQLYAGTLTELFTINLSNGTRSKVSGAEITDGGSSVHPVSVAYSRSANMLIAWCTDAHLRRWNATTKRFETLSDPRAAAGSTLRDQARDFRIGFAEPNSVVSNLARRVADLELEPRVERIRFAARSSGSADFVAAPVATDPVTVLHGEGPPSLITDVTGNGYVLKAGVYQIQFSALVTPANRNSSLQWEIIRASDNVVLAASTSPHMLSDSSAHQLDAVALLVLDEDTRISIQVDRGAGSSNWGVALANGWTADFYSQDRTKSSLVQLPGAVVRQDNRGYALRRSRASGEYELVSPFLFFDREPWSPDKSYYFGTVLRYGTFTYALTNPSYITRAKTGAGTSPGTDPDWQLIGRLTGADLEIESSDTIKHDDDGELELRTPSEGLLWADAWNRNLNTGEVQARGLRDLVSFDPSTDVEAVYRAADRSLDNVRDGYVYFQFAQGPARGDGWRIDNTQRRGWMNHNSVDIVITEDGTKLRGQYVAEVDFEDFGIQPQNPDRLIVQLVSVSDGAVLAAAEAYDIRQYNQVTVPLVAPTDEDLGGSAVVRAVPPALQGILTGSVPGHPSWMQVHYGTVHVQADLAIDVKDGDIGPMQAQVYQPNDNPHESQRFRTQDVDTHLRNGKNFYWQNVLGDTTGQLSNIEVALIPRTSTRIRVDKITSIRLIMSIYVTDEGGRNVVLNFPEHTYVNGDRLWLRVNRDSGRPQRPIEFQNQKLTLWNEDNVTGRVFTATGGSTAPYSHVSFRIPSNNAWFDDAGAGILRAKRDIKQMKMDVSIPVLASATVVRIQRYRSDGVSIEVIASRQVQAGASASTLSAVIDAVKGGDVLNVIMDHPVTNAGWSLTAHAQTPSGVESAQVRTAGLLRSNTIHSSTRQAADDVWVRVDLPAGFHWADDRALHVMLNEEYHEWKVSSLHTRMFRELGGVLQLDRLGQARASTTDRFLTLERPTDQKTGTYLAPLADGGIAMAAKGPASDRHPLRIIAE